MRTKLPDIVKFCVLPFCVLFLSIALFVPTFLGASKQAPTGEATSEYQEFLPIILNQDENLDPLSTPTPSPTNTPTLTPTLTSSPPPIPPLPTFGITPSATPSPTPTSPPPSIPPLPTPGITPSATPSKTPIPTPTFTPRATSIPCPVQFEGDVYEGMGFVFITGDIGTTVTITDLSTGNVLGSDVLQPQEGHACPDYTDFTSSPLNEPLIAHHVLLVSSSDTTIDTAIVLAHQPTSTPTATHTATPTHTATVTPTSTPNTPYIILHPDCGQGPTVQVTILGFNWDNDEAVGLFWNASFITLIDAGHGESFSITRNFDVTNNSYVVRAESVAHVVEKDIDTKIFTVPCDNIVIPTATPTPTSTPRPADLTIGKPQLISTPPIVAHAPLQFSVSITNYGQLAVEQQFFVDIFLDPQNIYTDHIPLEESSGYHAVDSLAGGQSKQLTITAPLGFDDSQNPHMVYAMVDSVKQIDEIVEINNISSSAVVLEDTEPPTATPTPDGTEQISGVVFLYTGELIPQHRAIVKLVDPNLGVIAVEEANTNGYYAFNNIPPLTAPDSYTVTACFLSDSTSYSGFRTGVQAPNSFTHIIMLSRPCTH